MKKFLLAILLVLSFSAPNPPSFNYGGLVLIGGGFNEEVLPWIRQRSRKGPILVITCDYLNTERWTERLGKFTSIILSKENPADSNENFKKVKDASAILFDGGHQGFYIQFLQDTELAHLISKRYNEEGIILGGTSAGAMIMGEYIFSAKYGSISSEESIQRPELIDIVGGIFRIPQLEGILVDTHYTERERQGRLKEFISRVSAKGLGINGGTALFIDKDGYRYISGQIFFVRTTPLWANQTILDQLQQIIGKELLRNNPSMSKLLQPSKTTETSIAKI